MEQVRANHFREFHAFTGCDTVRFRDGGRYYCFRSWQKIKGSRKYSGDLEGNGSCLTSFTVTSRGSPVLCTERMREQMKSTSCDTGFSAGGKGLLISISYLPVTTHVASMRLELTTRPQFGNEVFNDAPKYLPLRCGCGWCTKDGKLAADCMGGLPAPKAAG